jgi:hypothetical protein
MAYTVNKTDGSIVATVSDGQIDQGSTDLTLIGKNFSGFGDYLNENFVHLLENFAGQSQPSQPITGQLWYDTSENRIKVYSGSEWKSVGTSALSVSRPLDISTGDFWYNTSTAQLFFFDGIRDTLVAPIYSSSQGFSGINVESVEDSDRRTKIITGIYSGGRLLGYYSTQEFTLRNPITDYNTTNQNLEVIPNTLIKIGFNVADQTFKWQGTADNSDKLGNIDSIFYVRKDLPTVLTESLTIQRNDGLFFGTGPQGQLAVENFRDVTLRNTSENGKITLRSTRAGNLLNYFVITPNSGGTDLIQIAPSNPLSTTTFGGSVEITGDLKVLGNTVSIDVSTLRVEDKNIELGRKSDGTNITDAQAYSGGVVLKGTTDHYMIWNEAETTVADDQDWDFSENIDIPATRAYKIGGVEVIRSNGVTIELTSAVTSAPGLISFGSQTSLTADNIIIDDNRISNNGRNTNYINGDPPNPTNIVIEPLGDVEFLGSPRLLGITTTGEGAPDQTQEGYTYLSANDPDQLEQATSKKYVTNLVRTRSIPLTLDITKNTNSGQGTQAEQPLTNAEIIAIVNDICPPNEYEENTLCRIATTRYYQEDIQQQTFTINYSTLYEVDGSETPGGVETPHGVVLDIENPVVIPQKAPPLLFVRRGLIVLRLENISSALTWVVFTPLAEEQSPYEIPYSSYGTRL